MSYIVQPYDDALEYILKNGIKKSNRTGVNTLSVFGLQTRYRIDENFPLITKRKLFPKSIFAELLWILSGSTNVKDLEAMGSKIWSSWRNEEFEKRNEYVEGDLGPIYGYQLRHFGVPYVGKFLLSESEDTQKLLKEHSGGFDQLEYVVNELKTNKLSRRILFSYWNPPQVTTDQARLPPCHMTFILNVDNEDRLSGMLVQRSGDYPIGIPFNIAFYSALLYMLSLECNLKPYELVHSVADAHIYENQIEAVEEYLSRPEIPSPTLRLVKKSITEYTLDDFIIENYHPLEKITIPVEI